MACTLDKHIVIYQYRVHHLSFPWARQLLSNDSLHPPGQTPNSCVPKATTQKTLCTGNYPQSKTIYWLHLLYLTTKNSACLCGQHKAQTLSPHTPVANPTFYRRGQDKTRKFITKKLNSYPLKLNKGRRTDIYFDSHLLI